MQTRFTRQQPPCFKHLEFLTHNHLRWCKRRPCVVPSIRLSTIVLCERTHNGKHSHAVVPPTVSSLLMKCTCRAAIAWCSHTENKRRTRHKVCFDNGWKRVLWPFYGLLHDLRDVFSYLLSWSVPSCSRGSHNRKFSGFIFFPGYILTHPTLRFPGTPLLNRMTTLFSFPPPTGPITPCSFF